MKERNNSPNSKWRALHPLILNAGFQYNDAHFVIPPPLTNGLNNFINSPNDRATNTLNTRLKENFNKQENASREHSLDNLHSDNVRSSVNASHDTVQNQGSNSGNEITPQQGDQNGTNNHLTSTRTELINQKLDAVINSPNAVSRFAHKSTDLKNITVFGSLHCPCNPYFDLDINLKSTLNGAQKLATVDAAVHIPWLQDIHTPEILQAALRAFRFTPAIDTFNLTPYGSFSTTGHKQMGLRTNFVREVNHSNEDNSINNNNSTLPDIHPQSIVNTAVNKNSADDSHVSSLKSSYDKPSVAVSDLNKTSFSVASEDRSSMPLLLKDINIHLVTYNFFQAASSVFKEKQGAYLCLGAVLITGRIVALRIRKSSRSKNKNMGEKIFIEKTKTITFVIDQSTDLSALAISFFCYPIASNLKKSGSNLFLLFLKYVSKYLPTNFFGTLFCFLDSVPLLDVFWDTVVLSLTFGLCRFF